MTFQQLAERFYESMHLKGYSDATLKLRRMHLNRFEYWCAERGIIAVDEVNRYVIERFQAYLMYVRTNHGRNICIKSQYGYLVTLRMWFKFLKRQGFIEQNPAADVELPKIPRNIPKTILTESEVEDIFNAVDVTTPNGIRDRAILETLYSTGMRRMEIAGLCIYDIDFTNATIFIREGKGKKDRIVPVGKRALFWLRKYLYEVRPSLVIPPDSQHVFISHLGHSMTFEHLSRLVREYVKKADISKSGGCHLFRHTMATMMHENGADIRYVQEMLGHSDIRTTQIYTQVNILKLKEIHHQTHPAEREPVEPKN